MKKWTIIASSAAFAAALAGVIGCGGSGCGGANTDNSNITSAPNYQCGAQTRLVGHQCVADPPTSVTPASVKRISAN